MVQYQQVLCRSAGGFSHHDLVNIVTSNDRLGGRLIQSPSQISSAGSECVPSTGGQEGLLPEVQILQLSLATTPFRGGAVADILRGVVYPPGPDARCRYRPRITAQD